MPQKISNSRYKKSNLGYDQSYGGGEGLGAYNSTTAKLFVWGGKGLGAYNSTTAKLFVEVSGVTGW